MDNKLFQNANEFSIFIETNAVEEGISCLQTIINYCEEGDLDIESVSKLISKPLKEKLALDFANIGMLEKNSNLYD